MAFLTTPLVYLGDFHPSATFVRYFFNTVTPSGVPAAFSNGSIVVTKGVGAVSSTSGIALAANIGGVPGWHRIVITLTSDPGFYSGSADFYMQIRAGSVTDISLSDTLLCVFSLNNRSGIIPVINNRALNVDTGGHAGIDWGDIANPTTVQNLTGTNINRVVAVSTVSFASIVGIVSTVSFVSLADLVNRVGLVSTDAISALTFTTGAINNAAFNVTETLNATIVAGGISAPAFANSAITASTFTPGAINNSAWNVTETVNATIIAGGISAPALANNTITASAFAVGAINNSAFSVTETLNATIIAGGISAAAFAANAITATAVDTSTRAVLANTTLGYDFSAVSQAASRSLLEANRFLRNRRFFSGGSLVVTQEDDTTQAWSAVVQTSSQVEAVTAIDPV